MIWPFWFTVAAIVVGLSRDRTPANSGALIHAPSSDCDREEVRARYEFDVIHREYGNHQRKLDSTESGLGVITLVAVTLIALHFADPKTVTDRILAIALGLAAWAGSIGLMLFRGYDPFYTVSFQRDYRENPSAAFHVKRVCAWISAVTIAAVEIAVSVFRWHGA